MLFRSVFAGPRLAPSPSVQGLRPLLLPLWRLIHRESLRSAHAHALRAPPPGPTRPANFRVSGIAVYSNSQRHTVSRVRRTPQTARGRPQKWFPLTLQSRFMKVPLQLLPRAGSNEERSEGYSEPSWVYFRGAKPEPRHVSVPEVAKPRTLQPGAGEGAPGVRTPRAVPSSPREEAELSLG